MTPSRGVTAVTWLSGIVLLLVPLAPLLASGGRPTAAAGVAAVGPLVLLGTWALAPRALEIGGGELRVVRRAWRALAVPLDAIQRVAPLEDGAIRHALRIFGVGGLFGYYGRFRARGLGGFRLYATRRTGLVEIVTPEMRLVVSPDRPEAFVEALRAVTHAGVASARPG